MTQMSETNVRPRKGGTPVEHRWQVFERDAQQNPHIEKALHFLDSVGVEYKMTERGLEMQETAYMARPGDGMKAFAFAGAFTIGAGDRDHLQLILRGSGHRAMSWRKKVIHAQEKQARAAETAAHGVPIDTAGSIEQAERQIAGITDPAMKAAMLRALADKVAPSATPPTAPAPVVEAPAPPPPVTVTVPEPAPELEMSDEELDEVLNGGA